MPCNPLSVSLQVNPNPQQQILIGLDKACNPDDTVEWTMHFQLLQGNPLANVVKLDVAIQKENHPQAAATAKHGLDESQRGQAQIAAAIATDPSASDDDKTTAAQGIISARIMQAQAGG
jgi:hypothetical protein